METTVTNTTCNTENTTTTLVHDSSDGGANQWKEERWHQENDDTSKRSSDTSIISHNSSGSGIKAAVTLCQDEIILEINSQHESNSDVDNGDILLQYDDDEENSEEKLIKVDHVVKAQIENENESKLNGAGINGFDENCMKVKMGW